MSDILRCRQILGKDFPCSPAIIIIPPVSRATCKPSVVKQPVSLRRSLFLNLTLGPIFLGAILLATSILTYQQVLSAIASELTGRAIEQMNSAFVGYLHPVQEIVELSKAFGLAGKFEDRQPEDLDLVFGPLIDTVTQVSSVHLADINGDEYMLMQREGDRYYNRLSSGNNRGWLIVREWGGDAVPRNRIIGERVASDYSVLDRPWFRQAVEVLENDKVARGSERLVWSEPYTFFTSKQPGITASVAYSTPSGRVQVLGFDILLNDIQVFAEKINLRDSGIVFVMLRKQHKEDMVILALPRHSTERAGDRTVHGFPRPVATLTGAPKTLVDTQFHTGVPSDAHPVQFSAEGKKWWGAAAQSPLSTEKAVWIAAIIPEKALLEDIPDISLITLGAVLLTVGLMVLRARWLARRYGGPLGELVAQTERMARLNFTREMNIQSPIYEVQTLASSQDAMRRSLGALTAMNERSTIARELKISSQHRRVWHQGYWQVAVCDESIGVVDGLYPMLWPVRPAGSGGWTRCQADRSSAAILILVSTQLRGMRAARHAPALLATARAHLQQTVTLESLCVALDNELVQGAQVKSPTAIACAVMDGENSTLEVSKRGAIKLLRWRRNRAECEWAVEQEDDLQIGPDRISVQLQPEDTVFLFADKLFDVLDETRHRLSMTEVEGWIEELAECAADELVQRLQERILKFTDATIQDLDLAFFVIKQEIAER